MRGSCFFLLLICCKNGFMNYFVWVMSIVFDENKFMYKYNIIINIYFLRVLFYYCYFLKFN